MESEAHQKQTDDRLDKIEKEMFDGTYHEQYKSDSARDHASHHEEDGQRHFLGVRNLDSAKQKIESFKNQYDEGAVKSLFGNQIQEYEKDLNLVNQLARIWSLPSIESLRK